jgi:hypothetical protein
MVGQRKIWTHDQFMSLEVKIPSYLPAPAVITGQEKFPDMIWI